MVSCGCCIDIYIFCNLTSYKYVYYTSLPHVAHISDYIPIKFLKFLVNLSNSNIYNKADRKARSGTKLECKLRLKKKIIIIIT